MREIDISAEHLASALLGLGKEAGLCLLDSSTATHSNSHQLIAGIYPLETCRIACRGESKSGEETLAALQQKFDSHPNAACVFTLSYDLGLKLENIPSRHSGINEFPEPDIFIAFFESLVVHDYTTGKTYLTGSEGNAPKIISALKKANAGSVAVPETSLVTSNFSKDEYLKTIARAKEFIHRGDTYQINLTQQLRAKLADGLSPENIFLRLREKHPAPFSAFISRGEDTVISASPERFLRVENIAEKQLVTVSPIKGTRPRGTTPEEDERLKAELLSSEKDRAENVMIVDLLRNDIGRVCKAGTVRVEELCAIEEHPTLFHLVSTIRGELRDQISFSTLLSAVFPCGSITGAPKIRTMQIIDELEPDPRGLSMGAIGYIGFDGTIDMSVAIRTMVVRDNSGGREAVFNVGGGIVIDSVPELEYEETLVKAKALLGAINGKLNI